LVAWADYYLAGTVVMERKLFLLSLTLHVDLICTLRNAGFRCHHWVAWADLQYLSGTKLLQAGYLFVVIFETCTTGTIPCENTTTSGYWADLKGQCHKMVAEIRPWSGKLGLN
jgi:hypothetical protein